MRTSQMAWARRRSGTDTVVAIVQTGRGSLYPQSGLSRQSASFSIAYSQRQLSASARQGKREHPSAPAYRTLSRVPARIVSFSSAARLVAECADKLEKADERTMRHRLEFSKMGQSLKARPPARLALYADLPS